MTRSKLPECLKKSLTKNKTSSTFLQLRQPELASHFDIKTPHTRRKISLPYYMRGQIVTEDVTTPLHFLWVDAQI